MKNNTFGFSVLKTKSANDIRFYWILFGIIAITFLVYYNSLFNGLIDWDDYEYIVRNNLLYNFTWDKLQLLYHKEKNITIPLASIALQIKLTGLDPKYFHIVNNIIHITNCVLVFLLTKKLTKNSLISVLVCAFFALNPTRVETAAWVMQRKDLFYTLFFLISALIYIECLKHKERKFHLYLFVFISVFLSSLSKIQALVIPLVFILFDFYFNRKITIICIAEKIILFLFIYLNFSFKNTFAITFLLILFTSNPIILWFKKIIIKYHLKENFLYLIKKYLLFRSKRTVSTVSISIFLYLILFIITFLVGDRILKISTDLFYLIKPASMWTAGKNQLQIIPHFDLIDRIFMMCYSIIFYLYQLFNPFNLCAMHPYPIKVNGYLPFEYYVSAGILIVILAAIIYSIYKFKTHRNILIFGFSFFFITIFMVCHVIPIEGRIITADRYAYLAYFGLFFIIAYFINLAISKGKTNTNRIIIILLTFLFAGYSYYSYSRIFVWKNSYTFWSDVAKKQPDNYYAYYGLGNYYLESGDFERAYENFNKSKSLNDKDPMLFNNLGLTLYNQKKYEESIINFDKAISIVPDFSQYYNNRGNAYYYLKDFTNALSDYNTAFKKWNKNTDALINKADLQFEMGQADSALKNYNLCIEIDSNSALPFFKIGLFYKKFKDFTTARKYLSKAIEKNPSFVEAKKVLSNIGFSTSDSSNQNNLNKENISVTYVNQGLNFAKEKDYKSALELFSKAIEEDPKNAVAYKNRGSAKGALNDFTGSIKDFDKAIELNPNDAGTYLNRGNSKFKINDKTACDDWRKAQQLGNPKATTLLNKHCN